MQFPPSLWIQKGTSAKMGTHFGDINLKFFIIFDLFTQNKKHTHAREYSEVLQILTKTISLRCSCIMSYICIWIFGVNFIANLEYLMLSTCSLKTPYRLST